MGEGAPFLIVLNMIMVDIYSEALVLFFKLWLMRDVASWIFYSTTRYLVR